MWSYFSDLIRERPILGYGPSKGSFEYAVADNNYIFIMFRYGAVGLVMTFTLWGYLAIRVYKRICVDPSDQASLALFLLAGVMVTSLFAETMDSMRLAPLTFFMCGLVLARVPVREEDSANVEG
jgi:O-antigen ligase